MVSIGFGIWGFFFFNDTATTEIYTLSLHDALPISRAERRQQGLRRAAGRRRRHAHRAAGRAPRADRKSTRLNSSHGYISYAVFCLKKKIKKNKSQHTELMVSCTIVIVY